MGCSTSWRERAPLLNLHSQSSSRGPWSNCQCHCFRWQTLAAPTPASSHAQSAISVCIDVRNCVALAVLSHCIIILLSACYGAGGESDGDGNWICQRCLARATRADCCLCLLRGGALKPTDGGQWAHLTCAMAIPEVSLGGAQRMQPVMTEAITRATRKMVHYSSRQKCLVMKCIVVCDTCAHFL